MSTTGWMIVAFVAAGAGVGGYLLSLVARRRRLRGRVDELQERGARF
ncbi:MAG: CcmD family protein [Actinomycetota bacterium]|nr:CcmD family protein [Actinomycetota bacterium]